MNLQYIVEAETIDDTKERCRWDERCSGFMFSAASKKDSIMYHDDKQPNSSQEVQIHILECLVIFNGVKTIILIIFQF